MKLIRNAGRLVNGLVVLAGLLLVLIVALLLFIAPIAHWAIEKYAPDFLGRKLYLNELRINLFTGNIEARGIRLMEQDQKQLFVYAGHTQLKLDIGKLITGRYHIDSILVDTLEATIDQQGYAFNFDDLLETLLAEDSLASPSTDTLQYSLGKIRLTHATLRYNNKQPAVKLLLSQGELLLSGLAWNNDLIHIEANALVNGAGKLDAAMDYNLTTYDYFLNLKAQEINTSPLFPYFADYITSTRADGLFSTHMQLKGNADHPSMIALRGKFLLDDFVLTDAFNDKQLGWKQFSIEIDSVNTSDNLYRFDNVVLSEPYLLFTMTPEGDNLSSLMKMTDPEAEGIQTLAGTEGTAASAVNPFLMLADLVGEIAEQYAKNEYGMNRFAIENGTIVYNDFLTNEKFSVLFEQFQAQTASFNDSSKVVKFDISTLMNRYGNVKANLAVDNTNYKDFDLSLNINSLTMSIFNPYTKYYVAHPFWRGDISFSSKTSVKEGALDSRNRLIVKQIKVGDKVKSDSAFNIPVRLAVAILRDRKGNIDLEIPIKGSLKDPDYKWGKAALTVLKNLLIKAVTAPYDMLAKSIGGNPEDLKMVTFDPLQDSLAAAQRKPLDAMIKVLTEKPEMSLKLTLRFNKELERDEMAVRTALAHWIAAKNGPGNMTAEGSLPADSLRLYSPNDSIFGQWLIQKTQLTSPAVSLQDKCIKVIGGKDAADALVEAVNQRRDEAVSTYLLNNGLEGRFMLLRNEEEHLNLNTPLPIYDAGFDVK